MSSASSLSPTEVFSLFNTQQKTMTAAPPKENRTRKLRFAQPDGGLSPEASPPIMRRAASSPGALHRLPNSAPSASAHHSHDDAAVTLDLNEALRTLKQMAMFGCAIGCLLLTISNGGAIREAVADMTVSMPSVSSYLAPFALSLDAGAEAGTTRSRRKSVELLPPSLASVLRAGFEGARDINHSDSAATESLKYAGPAQESSPVAAVFLTCILALVALSVARWQKADYAAGRPTSRPLKPRLVRHQ